MIRTNADRSASEPDFVLVTAAPVAEVGRAVAVMPEAVVAVTGCASPPKLAKHALELAWPQQLSTLVCPRLVQNWHTPSTSC